LRREEPWQSVAKDKALSQFQRRRMYKMKELRLTSRQLEILQRVADGESNPEIAKHLSISSETVKQHLVYIFRELGVHNRTLAATVGLRAGLIH
jgi:DNA-binding NarL/FixJ family response regulator